MDLNPFIRDIPDFPKPGILFKDITPLLSSPEAFRYSVEQMAKHYEGKRIDAIAAAEARGFLFAAPMAMLMNKPLVPLRKPGKLPFHTHRFKYDLEYGQAELHVHTDSFRAGDQVLIVDDVLATGGTMQAAAQLIEQAGAKVAGYCVLVELAFLMGRQKLGGHELFSLVTY